MSLRARTNIPIDGIMELLTLVLSSNYFRFGDEFYLQNVGLAMGSCLSPLLANIFMTELEDNVLARSNCKPILWKRYVDDILAVIPCEQLGDLDGLLLDLNTFHKNIQFTIEHETNSALPFLDVLIMKEGGSVVTSVYRKPTHTNQYLKYTSNHPFHVKKGIVECLRSRAVELSSNVVMLEKEKTLLFNSFLLNGYPEDLLRDILYRDRPVVKTKECLRKTPLKTICIEYVPNLSDKIRRILGSFNIRTVFKSSTTLRALLSNIKPIDVQQNSKEVVYALPCQCKELYVGETGRPLEIRIKEHRDKVKEHKISSSLVAEHAWTNMHNFNWDSAVAIYKESNVRKRKFVEAAFILCVENVISQPSYFFDDSWRSIVRPVVSDLLARGMKSSDTSQCAQQRSIEAS